MILSHTNSLRSDSRWESVDPNTQTKTIKNGGSSQIIEVLRMEKHSANHLRLVVYPITDQVDESQVVSRISSINSVNQRRFVCTIESTPSGKLGFQYVAVQTTEFDCFTPKKQCQLINMKKWTHTSNPQQVWGVCPCQSRWVRQHRKLVGLHSGNSEILSTWIFLLRVKHCAKFHQQNLPLEANILHKIQVFS